MTENQNPKRKQHFIPQFYLRNFAPNSKAIWQYDIQQERDSVLAPIDEICCERDLYELKDQGVIVYQNLIEDSFSKYESFFADCIRGIKAKAKINNEEKRLIAEVRTTE